jgi:virginiamycin B lyase
VRTLNVPTPQARPYGIVVAPDGRPWIVLFGTNKLATVDPASFTLREIPLPREEARPRRLVVTGDGVIWYGDYRGGQLGRYDPAAGAFREWVLPGGAASLPYAMTVDSRGRIWLVETGLRPNRLVRFDPQTATFAEPVPIPSGAGAVRHMVFHPATRAIWFGTDANTLGRARLTD